MRLALLVLGGVPLLVGAPLADAAGERALAGALLTGALACAAGALLAFHLPTTARRVPPVALAPLAHLAAGGGWLHAAFALPIAQGHGGPMLPVAAFVVMAAALLSLGVLVAAGRSRGPPSGPHRPTLLAAGGLLLAGYASLAAAAVEVALGRGVGDLLAAWAAAWGFAGLALVAPRLLKHPAPAFPLHLAWVVLLAVPATRAVPLVADLPAAQALPAAAALLVVALAPSWRQRPARPAPLLPHADALAIGGLALLIAALVPALDGPWVQAAGLAALAASLTLLLTPILANQTPRRSTWARAAALLTGLAALATAAERRVALVLALAAAFALAWTASRLARPRRACPPEAVLPD